MLLLHCFSGWRCSTVGFRFTNSIVLQITTYIEVDAEDYYDNDDTCVHSVAGYYRHYIIIKPGLSLCLIKTHSAMLGITRELLCQQ